jgi:hypothetical protein
MIGRRPRRRGVVSTLSNPQMTMRQYVVQEVELEIDDAAIPPPLDAALREGRYEHSEARR